jgi:transposase
MATITLLGIDLAKNVYQLHGVNTQGRCILKSKLSRVKLIEYISNLPPCTIAMEACSGANYFGRKFQKLGYEIKLIAPQYQYLRQLCSFFKLMNATNV